ncbi:hypothetical protein ACVIJ6_003172 [Bradyrhizobium sp. USDA 4369]|nr:hypothetical protein [Bradyrhizobium sp.]
MRKLASVAKRRAGESSPVPDVVCEGELPRTMRLPKNAEQVGLHPLLRSEAFRPLLDAGLIQEEIAVRHFVKLAVVNNVCG